MKPKAPYGGECNNCGLCCLESLCPLAAQVFPGRRAPCPALKWEGEESHCGLVENPLDYAHPNAPGRETPGRLKEAALFLIGAGLGCDSRAYADEVAPRQYRNALKKIRKRAKANPLLAMKKLWLWIGGIEA